MASSILAQRYAAALMGAAVKAKDVKETAAMASAMLKALDEPAVGGFITNPTVQASAKKELLEKALGSGYTGSFRRLVDTVLANRREAELAGILDAFLALVSAQDRQVQGRLVTATQLSGAQRKTLEASLSKRLKRKVELVPLVDASLIGGGVLKIEDTVYDGSLRSALRKLKAALLVEPKKKAAPAPKAAAEKKASVKKKAAPKKKAAAKKAPVKKKAAPKKAAPKKQSKKTTKKKAR